MITKVLNSRGEVLHDCAAIGCENSWDGYSIAGGELVDGATGELPDGYFHVDASTVRVEPR